VVPLAVSFYFFLRVDAKSVRWGALCAPRKAKLPYRQLNNPSCHIGNLRAAGRGSGVPAQWRWWPVVAGRAGAGGHDE
jgi:hypothetical protein